MGGPGFYVIRASEINGCRGIRDVFVVFADESVILVVFTLRRLKEHVLRNQNLETCNMCVLLVHDGRMFTELLSLPFAILLDFF